MILRHGIYHVRGDVTSPVVAAAGTTVIAHLGNDRRVWGKSALTKALDARYPAHGAAFVHVAPRHGDIFATRPEPTVVICSLYGLVTTEISGQYLDYGLFEQAVETMADACRAHRFNSYTGQITFHMPRIGEGTSGGDWGVVEAIIENHVARTWPVFVYSR